MSSAVALDLRDPDRLRGDTLADSIVVLLALTVVQRLVGFVRAVLFCRWLDAEQLGQWDMAFGFLVLAAPIVVFAVPGVFGRYVEHYRRQGQLKTLLRRTTAWCACLAVAATAGMGLCEEWLSELLFGTPDRVGLVRLLAGSLAVVVAFHFLLELVTGLRQARVLARLQLLNSAVFALLGVVLLLGWQATAAAVVVAWGGACLIAVLAGLAWLHRAWPEIPQADHLPSQRTFWAKLLPFAAWIWVGNLLLNLFDIVDRYMIVHAAPLDADAALALVGQYHSSRVLPLLLVSIATMLGGFLMPHLSCDWEAGRRRQVSDRLNLFLKMLSLGMVAAAALLLAAAPLLFGVAFQGKFAGGEAILPWTLVYSMWFALAMVAQNYLWCAERAGWGGVTLAVGLALNVGLNLVLLPRLGLTGVALAKVAANALVLVLMCLLSCRLGLRMDRSTWLLLALPALVALGPWAALAGLAVVAVVAGLSHRLLTLSEKRLLVEACARNLDRLLRLFPRRTPVDPEDRGPLRVMFVITSMPVGGAETLLVELIRKIDRSRLVPEVCCLKSPGPLGEAIAGEVPVFSGLIAQKYDVRVLWLLTRLMRRRRVDAVVTVGTGGDKMFWGRLAAWMAGVPVICSSLHSTGLPDHVELPNRLLEPLTDAFVAVAAAHGRYLAEHEGCPADKVRVIPNGVDTDRFRPRWPDPSLRAELGLAKGAPAVGIVAALRPEKNHGLFLEVAALVRREVPGVRFVVVGDGPCRAEIEREIRDHGLGETVVMLGSRSDVPEILALLDVFILTSHMEANPVSILEAMASEKPVVAPRVGSIEEAVADGKTGWLTPPGDAAALARRVVELLTDPERAAAMGRAGREEVLAHWSSAAMVSGYEEMIAGIYAAKAQRPAMSAADCAAARS